MEIEVNDHNYNSMHGPRSVVWCGVDKFNDSREQRVDSIGNMFVSMPVPVLGQQWRHYTTATNYRPLCAHIACISVCNQL